jgi:heme/copper-type cytochrome/quinol oxidase subunit 4
MIAVIDVPTLPTYLFEPSPRGLLSFTLLVLLPLAAGFLSKQSWSSATKGWVLLGLAFVKTFVEAVIAGHGDPNFDVTRALYTTIMNFIVAVGLYFGLLRGSKIQKMIHSSGITD